jgi:hypothetical protein
MAKVKAVVLCVDEKSQVQALDRMQPGLPMKKGRCGTMTHDYKRNGTTCLFHFNDPKSPDRKVIPVRPRAPAPDRKMSVNAVRPSEILMISFRNPVIYTLAFFLSMAALNFSAFMTNLS